MLNCKPPRIFLQKNEYAIMRYRSHFPGCTLTLLQFDHLIAVAETVVEDDEEDDKRSHARAV